MRAAVQSARVRELCADPLVRHDCESTTALSHAQQIERIGKDLAAWQPHFTHEVLSGDDRFAVLVWNATGRTVERRLSGIEVFGVVEGRITEVWNTPYSDGHWG